MGKIRRFEKGGFATSEDSEANADRLGDFIVKKDVDRVPVNEVADGETEVTDDIRARTSPAVASKPQNFKSAFARARSAGDKTFEFGGKKYTTDLAKPSVPSAPAADTSKAYDKEQQYQRAQEAAQTPEGKAKRAATEKSQALEGSYPIENLAGGVAGLLRAGAGKILGRRVAEESAKRIEPTFREKELEVIKEVPRLLRGPEKQLALPKPTPRLGYDKAGAKAAGRNARAAEQRAEMLKENARRSGLREDASAETGKDFKLMKKGGSVKGYASGGSVSSASKRADGCAIRGKTRA